MMDATKAAVRNGEGGDLAQGFGVEAGELHPAEIDNVAIVGGAGPLEIAEYQARRAAAAEQEEPAEDFTTHRDM